MTSQTSYSLVGETIDNKVLESYRKSCPNATELRVETPREFYSAFDNYHFNRTEVTDKFSLLAPTAAELRDIYTSLYKYSFANSQIVTVERTSFTEYLSWSDSDSYLEEIYDRIFTLLDSASKYDVPHSKFEQRLEQIAEALFMYVNINRTSLVTRFTIHTSDEPTFEFVELPQSLHNQLYPVWYLANSLGILPALKKPKEASYDAPEELPDMFFSIDLPNTKQLCLEAKAQNRFVTSYHTNSLATLSSPKKMFTKLAQTAQRSHRYTQKLISAYQKFITELLENNTLSNTQQTLSD